MPCGPLCKRAASLAVTMRRNPREAASNGFPLLNCARLWQDRLLGGHHEFSCFPRASLPRRDTT